MLMPRPSEALPIGPEVDATPRRIPPRVTLSGGSVTLEPLGREHAAGLWRAASAEARSGEASWTYMPYGPYATAAALEETVVKFATQTDPIVWAARPHEGGGLAEAAGWLSLLDIQPANAAIEIGHIWFAPTLQRTRAATEALFLLLCFAADGLGYRRLVWKCNALNAPSRRAAERFGFRYEGTLRAHMVVKGRERDTAQYSLLAREWPACRDAVAAWLQPENFDAAGLQRERLSSIRARLAHAPELARPPLGAIRSIKS